MSQGRAETERILLLTEGCTTRLSAKTATGVLRYSLGQVVGLIDSTQVGKTAGELLGVGGNLPVFAALGQALLVQVAGDFPDEVAGVIARSRVGVRVALGQLGDGVPVVGRLFIEVIQRVE